MNQGKLEVVKQEMAIVNVDILGSNKLKWTGIDEFNSDDHDGYSISSKGFLPTVVDIMVILVKFTHSSPF